MTLSLVPWVLRVAKLSSVYSTLSSMIPSVLCTRMPRVPMAAAWQAALTQVEILRAQSALAPSQTIPVTLPTMFWMAQQISW